MMSMGMRMISHNHWYIRRAIIMPSPRSRMGMASMSPIIFLSSL